MRIGWNSMPLFLPADIVLVSGTGKFSSAIKFFEKTSEEEESFASHVGSMINQFKLIEALWRVRINDLTKYQKCGAGIVIIRNTTLNMKERYHVVDCLYDFYKKYYGVSKIAGAAIDRTLFNDKPIVRKIFKNKHLPICSFIVAKAFENVGIKFLNKDCHICQPDDISDHGIISPDWVPVWSDSRITFREWIKSGKNRMRHELETL